MTIKRKSFRFALVKTMPIMVSYLFISMAYGILLAQAHFDFRWAWLSSGVVYSGAFQFVLVTFLSSGASLLTVALTALFLNSRHVFYGLSLVDRFRKMGKRYPYMIFTLTDETYSLYSSVQIPEALDEQQVLFDIAILARAYWLGGSVLGAVLGASLPLNFEGVDFCLTALFVTIVIDQWRTAKTHLPALIGLLSGMGFLLAMGPDRFILPALMVTAAVLMLHGRKYGQEGEEA